MDTPTLTVSQSKNDKALFVLLVVTALTGGVFAFPLSYLTNTNELIALCLIPFVVTIQRGKRFNFVFFSFFLLFGVGSVAYGVRMFYFFTLAFYLLWLVELFFGRVNILSVFLLGFMSPVFYQVSAILGFPIRLQLSQLAGAMLNWMNINIKVEGNIMLLNGSSFAVDDACMGLNMLAISMLMGVFILGHNCRVSNRSLRLKHLILFFGVGFGLNIIANLFRIMILVLLKIGPESPAHEITGILCLCIYVLIPFYFLGKLIVQKFGDEPKALSNTSSINGTMKFALVTVSLCVMLTGVNLNDRRIKATTPQTLSAIPGYDVIELGDGVTKMAGETLIYIKPIQEFFTGEHTPLICWKGSGYTFSGIGKTEIDDKEIYCGQLIKEEEKLFTAWWYTNGKTQTINQLDWRVRMLRGENKFSLVNVTASSEQKLRETIKSIFEKDLIKVK